MLKILSKFFDFCGGKNKRKFYQSIVFGIFMALFDALKIPAIVWMLDAVIGGRVTPMVIWQCLGICLVSVIGGSVVRYLTRSSSARPAMIPRRANALRSRSICATCPWAILIRTAWGISPP